MDDDAVYSGDFDEHLRYLEATLQWAVDDKMQIHPAKAHFCCTNSEFIDNRVSKQGIYVMFEKTESILAWEQPNRVRDVMSFLGITGYHGNFIHGYADLSCP